MRQVPAAKFWSFVRGIPHEDIRIAEESEAIHALYLRDGRAVARASYYKCPGEPALKCFWLEETA